MSNRQGYVYKCRRCGCLSLLPWDRGCDLRDAMSLAVQKASYEDGHPYRETTAGNFEGPRLIGMHICDPLETNGVKGVGISDLIGYDEK